MKEIKKADDLASVLEIDHETEINNISAKIRSALVEQARRRGLVVAVSGGIDSSVCVALAAAAMGKEKTYGLLLPERDSSPESLEKGEILCSHLGIEYRVEDIAPVLDAFGCYRWRDEAIKRVFTDYSDGWKNKIVISGGLEGKFNYFKLVVQSPDGETREKRLGASEYLQIVAATNFKQRTRKTYEYFHADRLNYAVVGTPNRLEYDQGFFVKNGDGAADIKPIAHLYKTQVYSLARYMELPEPICSAAPTTDTYTLPQGQDEFYFALPYDKMDIALWCHNHGVEPGILGEYLEITENQARYIYKDIETKRRTTRYLHDKPILMEEIKEIST